MPRSRRARPLWELEEEENKTRLRPGDLPGDELDAVLRLIVGDNQEYPPSAFVPLFQRRDREEFVASRPTFDARGLVPPVFSGAPTAQKPVEVSSGESRGEGEEEVDSEKTLEEVGETSPLSKAEILRALPDDVEADTRQEERGSPSSRQGVGRRWCLAMPPPSRHLLGLAPALLPHRLPPPEPERLLLMPRCCQASSSPSGSMLRWISKCLKLRLVLVCTRHFLMLALG